MSKSETVINTQVPNTWPVPVPEPRYQTANNCNAPFASSELLCLTFSSIFIIIVVYILIKAAYNCIIENNDAERLFAPDNNNVERVVLIDLNNEEVAEPAEFNHRWTLWNHNPIFENHQDENLPQIPPPA